MLRTRVRYGVLVRTCPEHSRNPPLTQRGQHVGMKKPLIVAGLVMALLAGSALPASAAPSAVQAPARSLTAVQAAAAAATASRIAAIDQTTPKVQSNVYLSDAHRSTILGTLAADRSAMVDLAARIAAETDLTAATTLYESIFTGYRVYAVALPQTLYAASADALTDSAIPALEKVQQALEAALAGPYASKSTPEIEASMASLDAQLTIAKESSAGQSAAALAVTPSAYNANRSVLTPIRESIVRAVAASKQAALAAQSVKQALQ
ncbi:hypothetical protein BH09ACT3_BH09ACT3_11370 [soil metagenome]